MKAIDEFIEKWQHKPWNVKDPMFESDLTALIEDACREQREACAELCMYPVDLPVFKCDEIKARIMNTPLITNKPESDE